MVINSFEANTLVEEWFPMKIFHITEKKIWENALREGRYLPEGYNEDGFIHCSELDQVLDVADAFYSGQDDLVLLEIDSHRVNFPVKYESTEGNEKRFPHLYGPLILEAVLQVYLFNPDDEGGFRIPEGLIDSGDC